MTARRVGAPAFVLLIVAVLTGATNSGAHGTIHASFGALVFSAALLTAATTLLAHRFRHRDGRPAPPPQPADEPPASHSPTDSTAIHMVVVADDGTVAGVSRGMAETSGLDGSAIEGKPIEDLPPTTLVGVVARYATEPQGLATECETVVTTPNGLRHFRICADALAAADGKRRTAVAVDITNHRRLESALDVARQRAARDRRVLHALIDAAHGQLLAVDTEYRVVAFNEPCRRDFAERFNITLMTGLALDDVLGAAGSAGERRIVQWSRALAGEEFVEISKEEEGRNTRHFETSYSSIRDPDGQLMGATALTADVSELRSVEGQLRQSQKLEAVGQLTGGIAHEINNLLTVINTTCDILRESLADADPEVRRDVEAIRGAAGRGSTMIRKLLSFSRRQSLEVHVIDVATIVYELSDVLSRILPEHVTVDTRVRPPVSAVLADPGAVEQIVINLATNARDAMPDGGRFSLAVHDAVLDSDYCAVRPGAIPGNYVCIAVTDTGIGMDAETVSMIFQPFFTTKPSGVGTGLGMSMIYGLVKQQRGYVDVESERGIGTTVRIYLPATTKAEHAPVVNTAAIPRVPAGTETILLVEDQEDLRRAGKRILERFGYHVFLAADGEEAIEIYETHREEIDLVVTDVIMPRLGGKQLYDRIGRQPGAPKFLFTSGYSAEDLFRDSLLEMGQPLLHKPWSLEEFVRGIQESLAGGDPNAAAPHGTDTPDDHSVMKSARFRRLT